jgi:hypothetical protein
MNVFNYTKVSVLKQMTDLLNDAVRIKNGVNLYKISIIENPFSMTWTKQGLGFARTMGRLSTTIGLTSKTENSEDTAARNIAAMYPVSQRDRIIDEFKQIVGGKRWASVADKIIFTPGKISVYVGFITGTKDIKIDTPDIEDEDGFKEKIRQMYINMNDDTITRQPGQENLMVGINENDK